MENKPYRFISADDHIGLRWLPKDLWRERLPARLRPRGPHVVANETGSFCSWGDRPFTELAAVPGAGATGPFADRNSLRLGARSLLYMITRGSLSVRWLKTSAFRSGFISLSWSKRHVSMPTIPAASIRRSRSPRASP